MHLVSVLIVLIYEFFGKETILWVLMTFLIAVLFLDYLRLEQGLKIPLFHTMYREKEACRMGGHIYFSLGSIASIALFSREIAYAAVLMATFGDFSAAFVGKFCGKHKVFRKAFKNNKTLEGSTAEFFVDFVIGFYFLGNPVIAFLMAFFATLAETAVNKIDDNLAVPVISGFFGQLAFFLLDYL
ncbi:MAG: SEC59/DGK1/VTE5 family protein [Methanosarcinaceae archaeon]|nr:SEC59/DGK1/VTE5 family protein [Methanosarcinaceae archaeon]